MKREWSTITVIMACVLLMTGCVSSSKYQEALTEADIAKEELGKAREQKIAMEQQIRTLKELNVKVNNEANVARDELQRIQHSRDKERGTVQGRTSELEGKVKSLSVQNRNMRRELKDVNRHNDTLKSMVARYQKELKDRSHMPAGGATPAPVPAPAAPSSAVVPEAPAAPAAPAAASGVININKAAASDLVLFLGVTQEEADRIVNNRPYRVKGELVAKNVVPKGTFDTIKDRITVSQ
ncbi:MAG: helix-hairpin-helix domain-containing protein [Nitrospira sp.]|nr:helix-hairpin-helix domain-containing protein [Nitrospira sp.]